MKNRSYICFLYWAFLETAFSLTFRTLADIKPLTQQIMRSFTLCILAVVLLIGNSCQKKQTDISPDQELFPVKYNFINASSGNIWSVNLTVRTYFPKINSTNIWYKNFTRVSPQESISMTVDTTLSTRSLGYLGCFKQMEVNVRQELSPSRYYVATWITKLDTIKTKLDAQTYFVWPKDTLTSMKTEGYYVN